MTFRRFVKLTVRWAWNPNVGSPVLVAEHEAYWQGVRDGRRLQEKIDRGEL